MPQAERSVKISLGKAVVAIVVGVIALTPACSGQLAGDEGDASTPGRGGSSGQDVGGSAGGQAGAITAGLPPFALARRLTREQYAYVVKDVLGVSLDPGQLEVLPAEPLLDGWSGLAANLTVFSAHAEGYFQLADAIARGISNFDAFVAKQTSCTKITDACRQAFVKTLGRRLFRRPLEARELEIFSALFAKVNGLGVDFAGAAQAVLSAMLQSPQFLYRIEREDQTPQAPASGYEIASRLSFLLWSSAPSDDLLDAAGKGALNEGDALIALASKMLLDDKARRASERFARDFLCLDTLLDPGVERVGLTAGLRHDLANAAVAFYQDHVWQQKQPLQNLFTSRKSFFTPAMAGWYGLTPSGTGIAAYEMKNASASVWVRAYSTGTEDNGVHVGLDGQWPASGSKLQFCNGKNAWTWSSAQRDSDGPCGKRNTIFIDVQTPGEHLVEFGMREDGFEFDKFVLTTDAAYVPMGAGPEES